MLANNVPDASFRGGTAPSGRICWSNGMIAPASGVPPQQRGGSGELFTGFDRGPGVWLLALMCSTCQNPAPILLTVLEPT